MNDSADQLRAYVERWERLEEERAEISADLRDLRKEAKGSGFDVPTMALMIKRRKLAPGEVIEADALLETYEAALGCGAASAGTLETKRGADGRFEVKIVQAPAAPKISKKQEGRRAAVALAELAKRARES